MKVSDNVNLNFLYNVRRKYKFSDNQSIKSQAGFYDLQIHFLLLCFYNNYLNVREILYLVFLNIQIQYQ